MQGATEEKMRHGLKTLSRFFEEAWLGCRAFEIRNNDRDFKVGDRVDLMEWDAINQDYTGREIEGRITYITDFEQKKGFVVFQFSITLLKE